ncbi:hypothetical protein [Candidatus Uabimicrobium sp. HlEnr_7]|uniref:hypothetical protein n=1 Tax=Candidatus Uabimicrobium helgolandensis TaxID=3095367 RepID=UPI003556B8CD
MLNRIFLLVVCCLSVSLMADSKKEYDLTWQFRKGLVNIMPEKSSILSETFILENGKETKINSLEVNFQRTAHWTVENVINKSQAAVLNIIEGHKLEVIENGKRFKYDPNKSWSEQDSIIQQYKERLGSGVAFLLDIQTQKVLVTWDINKQGDGTYKREMYRGKKDPYELGAAYKQLVNKKVAVGHTWTLQRTTGQGFLYNYNYTFSDVVRYKKKLVAKIEVQGDILWNNLKLGTITGEMLHDFKTRLMKKYKITEKVEQVSEKGGKKYIRRFVVNTEWYLSKTNSEKK